MSDFVKDTIIKAEEVAKLNHAESEGAHGIADTVNFGHVKLTDDPNQFVENGLAITPSALKNAFDNYQPPIPKIPDAASFTKGINTMQP